MVNIVYTSKQSVQSVPQNAKEGAQRSAALRRLPFSPEDAHRGNFITDQDASDNTVVNDGDYEMIAQKICRADNNIGVCHGN